MIRWLVLIALEVQTVARWVRRDDDGTLLAYGEGVACVFLTWALWAAVLALYDQTNDMIERRR